MMLCRDRGLACLVLIASALCVVWAGEAVAEEDMVSFGGSLGWTFDSGKEGSPDVHKGGFTFGFEVSYISWLMSGDSGGFYGGYLDVMVTPNDDEVRVSFGPEIFLFLIGVDAGLLIRGGRNQDANMGMQVRGLIAIPMIPVFMPYVRTGFFFDDSPAFLEAGLLIKVPIELD